jgi:S1-C subfamily serine protease
VLQLENASGLRTATLDTTSTVAMGDAVTGVGNAGGTSTLTAAAGRVTGLKQTITAQGEDGSDAQTLSGLIEVGADIQSGDSGGPLYDAEGEVIGINTAASSGSSNITGYAITIEDALGVVSAIESGAETSTITIGYPAFLGVALDSTRVIGVAAGSPANTAGLVAGDTITAIDGTPVASAETLAAVIDGRDPGERVTVAWLDAAGASRSATLILSAGPAD